MDNPLLIQKQNKSKKNENDDLKKNIKKNLSISSNEYTTKKFCSLIQQNKNIYLDINKLLSKNHKTVLNPSILSKKGSSINKSSIRTNSLSNSNILLKSTEDNLLQSINNNEEILSPKKLQKKLSKKSVNKYENKILKNVIKFYQKLFSKENELIKNEQDNKPKNKSSTKILNDKLTEEIEKEKNKIIQKQKRKSAMISASIIPNSINNIKNTKKNSFFQFGIKTKKSKNFDRDSFQSNNIGILKGKKNSFFLEGKAFK